jgi:CheY-like chemotaxis protein
MHENYCLLHHLVPGLAPAETPLRLMVVDDNADAAEVLRLLLEALGHDVAIEHDARRAIERARSYAPQIMFLDIGLPDMDGYELVRHLRSTPGTADAIFVAVTGYGQPEDKARALESGFDHHVVKPVKLPAILALLDAYAGARQAR